MALLRHLRILAGGSTEEPSMRLMIKAAFATSDRQRVNQHFGAASGILIYTVTPDQATMVEFAQFGALDRDGHEDKLAAKLAMLRGCAVIYCEAVGGSAIQQLLTLGVQPLRVDSGASITSLLADLQAALKGDRPAWLDRAITRQNKIDSPVEARFAAMEAEGWQD
ncbi:MAG: nitrogen fixation protein NifX [Candidatus Competibacteraceae bacterium]|nr:nitrogen fixation protein NifX [Candidatus Competibacteraceae bacterium]MCP5127774.1 nitrogen fixation protein NifX [Gammaproteobacteria bacterium]